ncbi:MAG TPA: glycosyltransferase family 4 protein [Polyangiales bacterium]|nr:glycosyltransferase family 4 protein [Polyangiales bacterium]
MRVVLATLNFPPARGGIEQLCAELARELTALGVELHVIAPAQPGDAEHDAALAHSVLRVRTGRLRHAALASALHAELGRHPHSAVLFAQWTGAGASLLSPRVRRSRTFALAHAKELLSPLHGLRSSQSFAVYRRAVLGRFIGVIAVSRYSAERATAAGAHTVHVVNPGVDATHFASAPIPTLNPTPSPGPHLLTVARLVPRKGIDSVIAALPAISLVHPGVRYRVVGDGPDRARLLSLAAQHGVEQRVELVGGAGSRELPAIYAAADLFVMASREDAQSGDVEGFGLVLLEAQAAGTAVVAAQSGGMPDALLPGRTGALVPPDDPAALAQVISELLADRPRLQAMGEAARVYASTRSWRIFAAEVLAILQAGS